MNAEAAYNLGVLLMRDGKFPEALKNLDDAVKLQPSFVGAAVQRARVLTELGRNQEALHAWKQLTESHPAAWLQVARTELLLGHVREARAALREGIGKAGEPFREAASKDDQLRPLIPKLPPHS